MYRSIFCCRRLNRRRISSYSRISSYIYLWVIKHVSKLSCPLFFVAFRYQPEAFLLASGARLGRFLCPFEWLLVTGFKEHVPPPDIFKEGVLDFYDVPPFKFQHYLMFAAVCFSKLRFSGRFRPAPKFIQTSSAQSCSFLYISAIFNSSVISSLLVKMAVSVFIWVICPRRTKFTTFFSKRSNCVFFTDQRHLKAGFFLTSLRGDIRKRLVFISKPLCDSSTTMQYSLYGSSHVPHELVL